MNKTILHYTITHTTQRSIGGYNETTDSFLVQCGFPVDENGGSQIEIDSPYFETEYNGVDYSDTDSAAARLDAIVGSGSACSIVYHPAPDKDRPRMLIECPALETTIRVF